MRRVELTDTPVFNTTPILFPAFRLSKLNGTARAAVRFFRPALTKAFNALFHKLLLAFGLFFRL